MLKVDLHTHTADDPVDLIPYSSHQLIDRAAALGYDALAITLHERQLDVRLLESYAAGHGLVLIPGVERTVEGCHVLLLNFERGAEDVHSFDDLRHLKAHASGIVVAPHPYFPGAHSLFGKLRDNADLFDAVEYNAMFTSTLNFNLPAERFARRHGKPIVGNGDVHRLRQLNTTYSLVDADRNAASICAAIAAGRVRVVSHPLAWPAATSIISDLLWSMLRHGACRAELQTEPASV
jgi:hypothetical protein